MASLHVEITHDSAGQREASAVTSNVPQSPGYPSRHFDYAGRSWRLYKRSHNPRAPWYFEATLDDEKWGPKSLKTATWALAVEDAKLAVDALRSRRRELMEIAFGRRARQVIAPASSTFGELFARVEQLDMLAESAHRRNYVWGARKFFAFALGIPEDQVAVQALTLVNGQTGEQFFTRALAHAGTLPDQLAQIKFKRQCVGWFTNTKALFAADAVRSLPALGLIAPNPGDVAAFRASKPKRFKVSKASEFIAPSQTVLRATFRQWLKLGRTPGYAVRGGGGNSRRKHELQPLNETARRNLFIAIGYMLACGLRKAEVAQLRDRHVTRDSHGVPRLVARDIKVKNKSATLEVKPLNPFWHILQKTIDRNGWRGGPDDYVLVSRDKVPSSILHPQSSLVYSVGGHCDRTYWPFYHVGKWLRELGWRLQKTNHALRDCAGSLVTMKFGLDRAKIFCRHATRATTESHYSRFVDEDLMDNPKRLAWLSWAK